MSDSSGVQDQKALGEEPAGAVSVESAEQAKTAKELSNAGGKKQLSMEVKVSSPFRNYYKGQAYSLSAENATGPFDVLPHHPNFISLLLPCDLIIRAVTQDELKIKISGGIIHVKTDHVTVFLDV